MSALAQYTPGRGWDPRTFGTLTRPVHKSDVSELVGPYACPARFMFKCERELLGDVPQWLDGKVTLGTAAHVVLARIILNRTVFATLGQGLVNCTPKSAEKALRLEWMRLAQGREVRWYGKNPKSEFKRVAAKLAGALGDAPRMISDPVLAEAGFIYRLGGIWFEGHIDLVFRPTWAPDTLAIGDWKTGANRAHPLELQHGAEGAIYSAALLHGTFLPEETVKAWRRGATCPDLTDAEMSAIRSAPDQRSGMHAALRVVGARHESGRPLPKAAVQFDEFPSAIYQVHLADYVPYTRSGNKSVSRPEELAFHGMTAPGKVSYKAGDRRGPAWYQAKRKESDIPRMEYLVGRLVEMVRAGYLVEAPGEQCSRCVFADECLNQGYHLRGNEALAVEELLRLMPADNDDGLSA